MILDYLFTTGQAASALLLLYGAFLVRMPARKAAVRNPKLEDDFLLRRHILTDV